MELRDKLLSESKELGNAVKTKTLGYILAALGLVSGLAWNEAIKAIIERFFPLNVNGVWAKLVYAVIITLVAVFISVYLLKLEKRSDEVKK
ncbi:MAG: hypothetical protein A2538_00710 [Candidatus Magasanikbacteria bacterium RIFOXYD2_FULL_41_14]|uniref:Uncharacterized protein n=1 Tax=Candidatus Magasanikbacteria bacterium RIFOXYD2_FULL_41_14 TaxID=1798709 RepID=A0A1F6PDS5_9BACT|nr:MAG: hypothetical protein A2538_00710 [Candidatus Magasanikbacteria bacterium RIFOXYD2_FULL_41_14]